MAWLRLISWWFNHKPISREEASVLRNLLLVQTVSAILSLLVASISVLAGYPQAAVYSLGFGTGFIAAVRYYVWRYVG